MRVVLALIFVLCAAACDAGNGEYSEEASYAGDDAAEVAEEAASDAKQATYEEYGADSDGTGADVSNVDAYDVEDNGNYVCTQNCSGHEAGFEWAQENDISDASDCGGNSQSFIEGCEAFAEERQEQADSQAQEAAEQAAEVAAAEAEAEAEAEADAEYEDDY